MIENRIGLMYLVQRLFNKRGKDDFVDLNVTRDDNKTNMKLRGGKLGRHPQPTRKKVYDVQGWNVMLILIECNIRGAYKTLYINTSVT